MLLPEEVFQDVPRQKLLSLDHLLAHQANPGLTKVLNPFIFLKWTHDLIFNAKNQFGILSSNAAWTMHPEFPARLI